MDQIVGGQLNDRLHLASVAFLLPEWPGAEEAVVLAEDLLTAGFTGPATLEVACLHRATIRSEAELPIRQMMSEHGLRLPAPGDEDGEHRLLLIAFGYRNLSFHRFEGPFYARIRTRQVPGPLERALMSLLDLMDDESSPDARSALEVGMRAVVRRAHLEEI